jgi:hypothetical protein
MTISTRMALASVWRSKVGLNFGQVVGVNNLLALKAFSTFLFNYSLHEKPNFIERWAIRAAAKWIELRARKEFIELKQGIDTVSLSLNDCQTSMFTVLYLATQKELTFNNGQELFKLIADNELEFEKIKHPKDETAYARPQDTKLGA